MAELRIASRDVEAAPAVPSITTGFDGESPMPEGSGGEGGSSKAASFDAADRSHLDGYMEAAQRGYATVTSSGYTYPPTATVSSAAASAQPMAQLIPVPLRPEALLAQRPADGHVVAAVNQEAGGQSDNPLTPPAAGGPGEGDASVTVGLPVQLESLLPHHGMAVVDLGTMDDVLTRIAQAEGRARLAELFDPQRSAPALAVVASEGSDGSSVVFVSIDNDPQANHGLHPSQLMSAEALRMMTFARGPWALEAEVPRVASLSRRQRYRRVAFAGRIAMICVAVSYLTLFQFGPAFWLCFACVFPVGAFVALRRVATHSLWLQLAIGVAMCVFRLVYGVLLVAIPTAMVGSGSEGGNIALGVFFLLLAAVDVVGSVIIGDVLRTLSRCTVLDIIFLRGEEVVTVPGRIGAGANADDDAHT